MRKKILIGLAAVCVLFIGVATWFVATFDPNQYKGMLTEAVKKEKQRNLIIEGDIRLTFWPSLGIQLGKTSLSERDSETVFASLKAAHLSLEVLPLLRKRVVIDRVLLDGVAATLVRDKDGKSNLDDLLQPGQPDKAKDDGAPLDFDIAGIELRDANLTVRDTAKQIDVRLSGVNLRSGRIAVNVPTDVEFETTFDATQPQAVKGKISLKGGIAWSTVDRRLQVSQLDTNLALDGFGLKNARLAVKGAALIDMSKQLIEAKDLSINASATRAADELGLHFEAPQLSIGPNGAKGDALTGNATIKGSQNAEVKFVASGLSGSAKALALTRVALDFKLQQGQRRVDGNLATPLRGNLETRVFELPGIEARITVNDPALPQKTVSIPISGSLRADLLQEAMNAAIKTAFDESNIQARVGVKGFKSPAIEANVDIDRLNLDRYMPPKPKGTATGSTSSGPEKPIELGVLRTLNATVNIRMGSLQAQNIKATSVVVAMRAANGRLDVPTLNANLYGGSLVASASVSADHRYSFRQTLNNVSINPLMKDAVNKDMLEGKGQVTSDLTASGNTVSAIKRALNGTASLRLRDGAVKGINLAKSMRDVQSSIGLRKNQTQIADQTEKTDFSDLSASFTIKNGVASNRDLMMRSPFFRVAGSGDINIGQDNMDYVARATVVNTSTGQDGKDLKQLKDITVPVRVSGPFDRLSFEVQWLAISSDILKSTLKDKLMDSLGGRSSGATSDKNAPAQRPEDQLKNTLKGLFGR